MAQKSKTQRAKASAAKAAKKEQAAAAAAAAALAAETAEAASAAGTEADKAKKALFKKSEDSAPKPAAQTKEKAVKKDEKPKKERFKFFKDVKAELKRVTWPTKQEVLRWSIVVVVALLFFGLYVFVLDNLIVTPLLGLIAGIGA